MRKLPIHEYVLAEGRVVWRLGSSEIFCSVHGRDRLQERNITITEVLRVLSEPDNIGPYVNSKGETLINYSKRLGRRRVIYVTVCNIGGRTVVTTAFVKKLVQSVRQVATIGAIIPYYQPIERG